MWIVSSYVYNQLVFYSFKQYFICFTDNFDIFLLSIPYSDDDEMRRYEVEFLEWLGLGTYPNIPWKEYVMQKVIKYFNGFNGFIY